MMSACIASCDALAERSREEVGKTIPQVAINWLLQRPTVSTVLIGARNEEQLRDNLGAIGWSLTAEQVARLDSASYVTPPYPYYPYWNGQFAERSPYASAFANASRVRFSQLDAVIARLSSMRMPPNGRN